MRPLRKTVRFVLPLALFSAGFSSGCRTTESSQREVKPTPSARSAQPAATAAPELTPGGSSPAAASCPSGMKKVLGGLFTVGTREETFDEEENPEFETKVPSFCAGETEVTTRAYEECVAAGKCAAQHRGSVTCNTSENGRGEHPINCIDWEEAISVCRYQGGRLPTEVEWEYLARGGSEMRPYSFGKESPDGRTCWKNHQSCPVKSFPPGAFGLYDVTGNVWEWTSDWFGRHPWPALEGRHKIYKGGGWSRRFEKWMRPNLRNRLDPKKFGSHLGVRCVASLPGELCPYGVAADGSCLGGVEVVRCLPGTKWNGIRCAKAGDDERCPIGTSEVRGHGCVRPLPNLGKGTLDLSGVTRSPSPEFDADCAQNQPSRPHAYRYTGAGHLERNAVGRADGCKNRDVGVGFNSACCP